MSPQVQERGQAGTAHVGVDQQGPLAGLREDHAEIGRHRGLAVPRFAAGKHQAANPALGERQGGMEGAERLGFGRARMGVQEYGVQAVLGHGGHAADHRQHGRADVHLQFLGRAEMVVQEVQHVNDGQSAAQAQQQRQARHDAERGPDRRGKDFGTGENRRHERSRSLFAD